jgi:hypothetical protein
MVSLKYVTQRAGWIVLREDGQLVAEPVGRAWEGRWPVAPIVKVGALEVEVECPGCQPTRAGGRKIRHRHGQEGRSLGEGHRVSHGRACGARGYVVLLLDPDNVELGRGVRFLER